MKPTLSTYELVLTAAKNAAHTSIANRDNDNRLKLAEIIVRIRNTANPPWIIFEVVFGYDTSDPRLEPDDDLRMLVPWNSENNVLGEIRGRSF
jgi:hypothetical protein